MVIVEWLLTGDLEIRASLCASKVLGIKCIQLLDWSLHCSDWTPWRPRSDCVTSLRQELLQAFQSRSDYSFQLQLQEAHDGLSDNEHN